MNTFDHYAQYYDLAYQDKDYSGEVEFVIGKLGHASTQGMSLLELGCGTGRHAVEFFRKGYDVSGIDLSPRMIELAKDRIGADVSVEASLQFQVGDVRYERLQRKFDAVVSLFHVFSYQVSNDDLLRTFETAANHLLPRGRLLFDFWYGPAVLRDPPRVRVRRLEADNFSVTRIAEPNMDPNGNLVDVNYELIFRPSDELQKTQYIKETHRMRYLFLPELEYFLGAAGLRLVDSGNWLSHAPLSLESWNGWVVAEHEQ